MSNLKGYYVSACNRRGLVIFTRYYRTHSAMNACLIAREVLDRTNPEWWTIWEGDPAQPGFMMITKEG